MPHLVMRQRGLTPRSSGAPTAGHQARSGGTRYIFASPGLAPCRRRPLTSNVRQRRNPVQFATRVSACRREPNSHKADLPQADAPSLEIAPVCPLDCPHCEDASRCQLVRGAAGSTESSAQLDAGGFNTWRTTFSLRVAANNFGSPTEIATLRYVLRCCSECAALPNPSVKRRANGAPPGPGHRYAVHSLWPGPGGTPSSPAYLER